MKAFLVGVIVLSGLAAATGVGFVVFERDSAHGFAVRPQIHVDTYRSEE